MSGESLSESPSTSQDTSPGTESSAPTADTAQTSSEGTQRALSPSDIVVGEPPPPRAGHNGWQVLWAAVEENAGEWVSLEFESKKQRHSVCSGGRHHGYETAGRGLWGFFRKPVE